MEAVAHEPGFEDISEPFVVTDDFKATVDEFAGVKALTVEWREGAAGGARRLMALRS